LDESPQKRFLDKGKIKKLVVALRAIHAANRHVAEKVRSEADYFERNAQRMCYPKFRRQHLFVGSGVIEAGCKTVIGSRSNNRECSGPSEEPTPSWPYAALISMAALKITGKGGVTAISMPRTLPIRVRAGCAFQEHV
jgi:hypothetical protein